jgi:hypothetical protein
MDGVWAQLQELAPLPDISQFPFISGRNSISHLQHWPIGLIVAMPHIFSVTWQIETPTSQTGYSEVVQEGMTPLIDVEEAWQRLHKQVPRLFEERVIGYRGKLRPGHTIRVDVQRKEVQVTVRFETKDHGSISFIHEKISNMSQRSETHAYFAREDGRIPPYACYEYEDTRPYYNDTILTYHLRKDVEIPDTPGDGSGVAGGPNSRGWNLPPIIYPTAPIDISEGKVSGGKKGMPGPDSCATDSSQDEEGGDTHKLCQIAQAIHRGQPVTVTIRCQFRGYQQKGSVVLFLRDHKGAAPAKIMDLLETALQEIL